MREPEGFRDFLAARQATLVRVGWLLTGDAHLAEDLLQTALVKVLPRWDRLYRAGEVEPYLRRTMVTTYVSWRRRKWHREIPAETLPEGGAPGAEQLVGVRDEVLTALRRLPPGQRAVVVLRYFLDLSEAETARALNCGTGTVKSQTSRALATLRVLLPSGATSKDH